ncbi:MAG: 7-carboxy-7-deazaguanine synthase QueE [Bryobacteraceae bacterium]
MFVSELFYSIQGEGVLAGAPSVFIRTSGCNLRCSWCDTPYTSWAPEGSHRTLDELCAYVREHSTGYTVITGGEPMIAPEIVELTQRLRASGEHITVETAGTVYAPVECDLMSISPKLANSTPTDAGEWAARHERLRLQPEVLARLVAGWTYQLKFVVRGEEDLQEIDALLESISYSPDRVLLMPEGTDPSVLGERSQRVGEMCKKKGFRLSPRLHVLLYGNRRGT